MTPLREGQFQVSPLFSHVVDEALLRVESLNADLTLRKIEELDIVLSELEQELDVLCSHQTDHTMIATVR